MATYQGYMNQGMQQSSGKEEYQQTDWISADTINKVQLRKEKKGGINNSQTRSAKATSQEDKQSSQEHRKTDKKT